jgi:hypothetical protein
MLAEAPMNPTTDLETDVAADEFPVAANNNSELTPTEARQRLHALLDFLAWERIAMSRLGVVSAPTRKRPIAERFATLVHRLRGRAPGEGSADTTRRDYTRALEVATANRQALENTLAMLGRHLGVPAPTAR